MTFADNNLVPTPVPAQEKLDWVTPQISFMGAERTRGKVVVEPSEGYVAPVPSPLRSTYGPS